MTGRAGVFLPGMHVAKVGIVWNNNAEDLPRHDAPSRGGGGRDRAPGAGSFPTDNARYKSPITQGNGG